jgi:F-type H+-transporting ATPase subunit b
VIAPFTRLVAALARGAGARRAVTVGAAAILLSFSAADAIAQQPAPPVREPGAAPIRPRPLPGQRGRDPGIRPGFEPGFDPTGGRRPLRGLPPGHPPIGAHGAAADTGRAVTKKDEHGHCPGHGPHDSLIEHAHINWYQGLLGVDNEKAKSASFVDRLLWRYNNPEDECDAANQEPPVLAALINFAILVGLFVRFGRKPLADALAKRKKEVVQDLVSAKALGDEAEARLGRYEAQLDRLEDRRQEIQEEAALQWEAEKKRILAEAEDRRARMRRDAEIRVEQELKAAQLELLREAVEGAARAAEEVVARRIEPRDHDRLADEYLAGVGAALRDGRATTTATTSTGGAA